MTLSNCMDNMYFVSSFFPRLALLYYLALFKTLSRKKELAKRIFIVNLIEILLGGG